MSWKKFVDDDMWNYCISYVSWLYEGKIKIVEKLHEIEKKNDDEKQRPMRGEVKREWDPKDKKPKSLPREDVEWGMNLGTDVYSSVKAREQ